MLNSSADARFERFFRWALAAALLVGVLAGVLIPRLTVQAQAMEPQTYTVLAGDSTFFNTHVLAFAPQSLQVHRGDTVQWMVAGFHNIHFASGLTEAIIAPEVDGVPLPQVNPAVAFPNVESGALFQGSDVNSGLSLDPENPMITFSLVMDVEPGNYAYFCDIHPGMVGVINVVDDATPIPNPAEALQAAAVEWSMVTGAGVQAAMEASMQPPTVNADGTLEVSAGLQAGAAAVLQFFPSVAVIDAGERVTWSVAGNSREPHFVTWPPLPPGAEFDIILPDTGPPIIALNENALGTTADGTEVGAEGHFNSGFLMPGQSFTLTFTEPGVYNYVCFIHPGMQGAVVVMPQAQ
jgi:plastocyanin